MVIKASSGKEIEALVADLSSDIAVKRDGAVARLTVIGPRAVERLVGLASDSKASTPARVAAFRSLEAIGEPRAVRSALASFADPDPSVAVAALNTARVFLRTLKDVEALDRVTEIALDRRRAVAVRIAAIHAIADLPGATVEPVLAALRGDPDAEIANVARPAGRRAAVNTTERLEAAAGGRVPAEADVLRSAVGRSGAEVPLSTLHQIIERVRVLEGSESAERRAGWLRARAATHLALAERGSRLALYDLREAIESAQQRIPVEFFAAVTKIGDTSCLEPVASAFARSTDDWTRRHLADAFRAIVDREKLTRRHAAIKKIEKRWKVALDQLWAGRAGEPGRAGR